MYEEGTSERVRNSPNGLADASGLTVGGGGGGGYLVQSESYNTNSNTLDANEYPPQRQGTAFGSQPESARDATRYSTHARTHAHTHAHT